MEGGGGVGGGGVGWANNVIGTSCYTILFVLLDFHAYVILRYCMCLFDDDDDDLMMMMVVVVMMVVMMMMVMMK